MGDMVAPTRAKRGRSPSPSSYADTLASPLEVLLKRRRRAEWKQASGSGGFALPPPPAPVWRPELSTGEASATLLVNSSSDDHHGDMEVLRSSSPHRRSGYGSATDVDDDEPESSTAWMRTGGVERRRARAWERLQAPSSSSLSHSLPVSQPAPPQHVEPSSSSPAARAYVRARANSQPMPHNHHPQHTPSRHPHVGMSSSPVRHSPPSSTPFRGDEWTAEERVREWGDEYATQNSLLFSLHQARHASSSHHGGHSSTNHTPYSSHTMDMSHTPYSAIPTPYRYARDGHGLLETPSLDVSSPYSSSPELVSPFASQSTMTGHSGIAPPPQMDAGARANYEETNRLLAELNVQRMRRYQAPPPSPVDQQFGHAGLQPQYHSNADPSAMDES
ncbi:hypothetical protein Q8F55_003053 [Vanrija albida]|uniref:Uncharacterized protein n=1 Tax=Vanrija albida TaxID=181172 RepID=A0ABR3QBH9_9TREE